MRFHFRSLSRARTLLLIGAVLLLPSTHADTLIVTDLTNGTLSRVSSTGVVTPFASGLTAPIAVTATGDNFYVLSNQADGVVYKVTTKGLVSTFAQVSVPFGGSSEIALTSDPQGNLYVSAGTNNIGILWKVLPTGNVIRFGGSRTGELSAPMGLTRNAKGEFFLSSQANGGPIYNVTNSGNDNTTANFSVFTTGMNASALAVDNRDNLYGNDLGNGTIVKVTSKGAISTFASGLVQPFSLVADSRDNLYVSNPSKGCIYKITPAGVVSLFASGLRSPTGLAIIHTAEPVTVESSNSPPPPNTWLAAALAAPAIILFLAALIWLVRRNKE